MPPTIRIALLRPLARRDVRRFGPALAGALITRAERMGVRESSPRRAALADEAEALCRKLDRERPGRHQVLLARALVAQAAVPGGQPVATKAAKVAEAIGYVEDIDDRAAQAVLAAAQGLLAALHYSTGATRNSLSTALQAQTTWRRCVPRNAYERMGLTRTLGVIGDCQASLGRAEEALAARQKGMALYRALSPWSRGLWVWTGQSLALGLAESLLAAGQAAAAIALTDEVRGELVILLRTRVRSRLARGHLARLETIVSRAQCDLGRADAARRAAEIAVDHWRAVVAAHGEAHRAGLGQALCALGAALRRQDRPAEAAVPFAEAIRISRGIDDDTLAVALLGLAALRLAEQDFAGAGCLLAEAVAVCRQQVARSPESWSPRLVQCLSLICGSAAFDASDLDEGRVTEALAAGREAVVRARQLAAEEPAYRTLHAACLFGLERLVNRTGDPAESSELLRECVAIRRELFRAEPARHRADLAEALGNLGNRLHVLGRMDGAEDAHRECVEVLRGGGEVDRQALPTALRNLARTLARSGRPGDAERLALEAEKLELPSTGR